VPAQTESLQWLGRGSVSVIATYFGRWPVWLPAFLLSCARNSTIRWLILTDCGDVPDKPSNVTLVPFSLDALNRLASQKLGIRVHKSLYSQCDLRPAYGLIFEDHLHGVEFWGHCDLDVVWGDIRTFFNAEVLAANDVVSSRHGNTAGHLSLWRNSRDVNQFFRSVPSWKEQLGEAEHFRFDEDVITRYLARQSGLRVHWPRTKLVDYLDLEAQPYGWRWCEGRLFDKDGAEVFYMHFMTWKRYLKRIDFGLRDAPREFWVTRRGIWSRPPAFERILELVGYDWLFSNAIRLKRLLERGVWAVLGPDATRFWERRKRRQW